MDWIKKNADLVAILLIAFVMRIIGLDRMSLWVDEVYTAIESNPAFSLSELKNSIFTSDPHPPLYFVIVYFFFKVFGYTSFVLRFVSVLMGVAGVWATFKLGRELYNKNVGRYAAILATFNYFCLYYSQEGRMYAMLYLTTTLAFYYLIRFIKHPTNKGFGLYLAWSVLMIYSHLSGLFVLAAQYCILAFFIFRPYAASAKKMVLYTATAAVTSVILYIPVIGIIAKNQDRTSIWIDPPSADVFTQFYKDFFGGAEVVVMFTLLMLLLYWFQVMRSSTVKTWFVNPDRDKLMFSALIFSVWIFITLLLPLIRSYTDLPIMINRYFISIVPALLIMIAIGLNSIRSRLIQVGILTIILIFSLTDLLFVKQFYRAHYKSQFREVSQFIINNNTKKDPVVTRLGFYFPFYLQNNGQNIPIIDKPLDVFIAQMMTDSTKRQPFWYADAHGSKFELSDEQKRFLTEHFSLENSWEGYDAWARYYTIGSGSAIVELTEFGQIKEANGSPIKFNIDRYEIADDKATLFGWAFLENQSTNNTRITALLISGNNARKATTTSYDRKDVTQTLGNGFNLDRSGFAAEIGLNVPTGVYEVGLLVEDSETGKRGLVKTGKTFSKN